MKIMRMVIILLVIAAVATVGAFLYSKRSTAPTQDINSSTSINPSSAGQTPSDAVVFSGSAPAREITIEASEYKFIPSTITVKKGESVKITLKNAGAMPHDWFVENMGGASIDMTSAGSSNSIVIKASQSGTFVTYCSIGSHRKLGMVGTLVVQ
jgi:plastocyanin